MTKAELEIVTLLANSCKVGVTTWSTNDDIIKSVTWNEAIDKVITLFETYSQGDVNPEFIQSLREQRDA